MKVEVVKASELPKLVEKLIKIVDPELAATRRKNLAKREPSTYAMVSAGMLRNIGLLALNRDVSDTRWKDYMETMLAGGWYSTPDPIVITDDGLIINGQHRLLAACHVTWDEGDVEPEFVIVWGVDKETALLMDEARRSADDRRDIALRFARERLTEPA